MLSMARAVSKAKTSKGVNVVEGIWGMGWRLAVLLSQQGDQQERHQHHAAENIGLNHTFELSLVRI
jgi:hypothetical protein